MGLHVDTLSAPAAPDRVRVERRRVETHSLMIVHTGLDATGAATTETLWVGDASVAVGRGVPVPPGWTLTLDRGGQTGELHVCAGSGTIRVSVVAEYWP